jgi:hypothetical protein
VREGILGRRWQGLAGWLEGLRRGADPLECVPKLLLGERLMRLVIREIAAARRRDVHGRGADRVRQVGDGDPSWDPIIQ